MVSIISGLLGGLHLSFLKGFMIWHQNRGEYAFPLKHFFFACISSETLSLEVFQKHTLCIYRLRYLYGENSL